jgi:Zn-dependent peptidase ImmA (M78 family)
MLASDFRQRCEYEAVNWRRKLGLYAYDPLPANRLAAYLDILLLPPGAIPDFDAAVIMALSATGDSGWSAVTIPVPDHSPVIIYNPCHAAARHEANIMHELAHLLLGHKPISIQTDLSILRQSYRPDDEEQAAFLGGCLQITRIGLDWAIGKGMRREEIAHHFGASEEMVQYRLNMTGRSK